MLNGEISLLTAITFSIFLNHKEQASLFYFIQEFF